MLNLYSQYTDLIRNDLRNGQRRGAFQKGFGATLSGTGHRSPSELITKTQDQALFESLNPIGGISGLQTRYDQRPGAHPSFGHIKTNNTTEEHYIVSTFIDIKGSTQLFRHYMPFVVARITSVIQRAAMHTCWHFGGFVQRFHGDGLFIYFGDRHVSISQAVKDALNAASLFTLFVKNDLKNLFYEQGIENIRTRIGIDVGESEDVLWYLAGMGDCSEVTTCSLHTSLAAHMQSNAPSNGIMVGDNVKQKALLPFDLYSIKKNADGREDRYIFQNPEENFNYTQWIFDWERHLKSSAVIKGLNKPELPIAQSIPAIVGNQPKNMDYLRSQVSGYKPYFRD